METKVLGWAMGSPGEVESIALVVGTCLLTWYQGVVWQEKWYDTRTDADLAAEEWTQSEVDAGFKLLVGPTEYTINSSYSLENLKNAIVNTLLPIPPGLSTWSRS